MPLTLRVPVRPNGISWGQRNKAAVHPGLFLDDETADRIRHPGQGAKPRAVPIRHGPLSESGYRTESGAGDPATVERCGPGFVRLYATNTRACFNDNDPMYVIPICFRRSPRAARIAELPGLKDNTALTPMALAFVDTGCFWRKRRRQGRTASQRMPSPGMARAELASEPGLRSAASCRRASRDVFAASSRRNNGYWRTTLPVEIVNQVPLILTRLFRGRRALRKRLAGSPIGEASQWTA